MCEVDVEADATLGLVRDEYNHNPQKGTEETMTITRSTAWNLVSMLGIMATGAIMPRIWQPREVVRAERVEIVDSQGNVKAWLGVKDGETTLVLVGTSSTIGIGTGSKGEDFLGSKNKEASSTAAAFVALAVNSRKDSRNNAVLTVDSTSAILSTETGRSFLGIGSMDDPSEEARASINLSAEGKSSSSFGCAGLYATESGGDVVVQQGEDREAHFRVDSALAEMTSMGTSGGKPFGVRMLFDKSAVSICGGTGKEVTFP